MKRIYGSLDELPLVLTAEEVAQVFGIGKNQAYDLIRAGEIPSVKIGRRYVVPKRVIARILGEEEEA